MNHPLTPSISQSPNLLDRLAQLEAHFERWEPVIYSFVPEARRWERLEREAQALLARYPEPAARPPLFGALVGVKDIFHVDGLPTRGGAQLPAAVLAGPEAEAVTRLKAAGALIVGKTVTTEFAWFGAGPTRNPHNPFHTPGGSSSGSAAAVAAGLCTLALGSQTIGSINRPAAFCGVVGYKPTYDRISKAGVLELAASHDHVGLLAPDAASAELAASLLCFAWQPTPDRPAWPALAIPDGPLFDHVEPEGLAHLESVCAQLAAAGVTIRRVAALPDFEAVRRQHQVLLAAEAAHYHAQFAVYHQLYHPKTAELIADGRRYSEREIALARQTKTQVRAHLTSLLDEHGLDLWLTPSAPGPAPAGLSSTGSPALNLPFTNAGLPTLTLPCGAAENGLPLAIQLAGRWGADEMLFRWGRLLADLLPKRPMLGS